MRYKLGRKAWKQDSRTLKLSKYMAAMPTPPMSVNWDDVASFGMMGNDELGDCVFAGIAHAIQIWSIHASKELTVPDSVVISYYSSWAGYVPGDPSTDNGAIELDTLNKWKAQGFSGHKLTAFADPSPANLLRCKQAIQIFGGLYIGFQVTDQALATDNDPSTPWDVTPDDTIAGGHCVFVIGYDQKSVAFISWGQIFRMTWAYWRAYVQEAHALISPDMIASSGLAASGFNTTELLADLAAIS